MSEVLKTTLRPQNAEDIIQQVQRQVEDTLLHHAPLRWPDEELDAIEETVLAHTRLVLESLSAKQIRSAAALDDQIRQAVAETKRLIKEKTDREPILLVDILDKLARSTLLPEDLSEEILAGAEPPLEKIVMALVIGSLDCHGTLVADERATMNEKRIARAVATVAFLVALLAGKGANASTTLERGGGAQ